MGVAFPIVSMAGVGAINALLVVLAFVVLDPWTNLPNKKSWYDEAHVKQEKKNTYYSLLVHS